MKLLDFLPNINLINNDGQSCKFHDMIKGRTVIFNMFYSNCKIKCIPLGKLMRRVNHLLKDYISINDIHFISITLDAENDTVDNINKFKNKVWDDKCLNWNFHIGDCNDIERLRYKLGMYSPEKEIDLVKSNHSGSFLIFNEKTGFSKHTQAFDNPIDIARKIIQMIPKNLYTHTYSLDDINYDALTDDEMFENIQTMNSMFTVPFLPDYIKQRYDIHAQKQRGFQYEPPIDDTNTKSCCCKKK
jgi:cytochrome oxidase Cu insertion factor (SCO1/SenC/PrrC family)